MIPCRLNLQENAHAHVQDDFGSWNDPHRDLRRHTEQLEKVKRGERKYDHVVYGSGGHPGDRMTAFAFNLECPNGDVCYAMLNSFLDAWSGGGSTERERVAPPDFAAGLTLIANPNPPKEK